MTAALRCVDLTKRYHGQHGAALGKDGRGVSFEVERGELFALLGPSGCGKSTTLRIIGGFVDPDSGSVSIDDKDVTRLPAHRRPTSTVFQSYALFPHLRLGQNVSFGPRMGGVRREDCERRASECLKLVGLGGLEHRKISELSGGQQQRAALARALAIRPSVLLLDEPLGALDLKLRRQMQDELVALKRETGTTFVHVTHDQEEACAIADRIAIMDRGQIVQIDSPRELYRSPRTTYVANFINLGTVVRGHVEWSGRTISLKANGVSLSGEAPSWLERTMRVAAVLPRGSAKVEHSASEIATNAVRGRLDRIVFGGLQYDYFIKSEIGMGVHCTVDCHMFVPIAEGADVTLRWGAEDILFVEDTGE